MVVGLYVHSTGNHFAGGIIVALASVVMVVDILSGKRHAGHSGYFSQWREGAPKAYQYAVMAAFACGLLLATYIVSSAAKQML